MTLAAAGNGTVYWYLTRSLGVGALVLLTASVALGVLSVTRWRSERWPRFVTTGLHRNLTLLAICFVAGHVVTTVADGYTPIGVRDAFIPFVSSYRPIWLGLGAVASDLLLALVVTSLLRERIGYRAWRYVHWLAYASWPVALVHALGTGSDAAFGWMRIVGAVSIGVVVLAALVRVARSSSAPAGVRFAGAAAALVVPVAVVWWYESGPAQGGWARRAGTPVSLLASSRTTTRTATASVKRVSLPRTRFSATLTGSEKETNRADGLLDVVIRGRVHGGAGGTFRLDLRGQPLQGGVSMTASGISYVPAGTQAVYLGSVTSLSGRSVIVDVATASGARLQLSFGLNINAQSGVVTGTMDATPGTN
ncbi:MAG TPA: ferric reductase-like transmembrane domain-containing protein [Gaiellaceae bacterium]|jgi:DMSO/TMAO reductase YedYZ heme-binding membrane subunit|nr:ferric reductase-like transmembrane domain-containing protein [Gaiellaceae bacterium]